MYLYESAGQELGFLWLEADDSGAFLTCSKSLISCDRVFHAFLKYQYPDEWHADAYTIEITEEMFVDIIDYALSLIR